VNHAEVVAAGGKQVGREDMSRDLAGLDAVHEPEATGKELGMVADVGTYIQGRTGAKPKSVDHDGEELQEVSFVAITGNESLDTNVVARVQEETPECTLARGKESAPDLPPDKRTEHIGSTGSDTKGRGGVRHGGALMGSGLTPTDWRL
jgi:hypothetical protein